MHNVKKIRRFWVQMEMLAYDARRIWSTLVLLNQLNERVLWAQRQRRVGLIRASIHKGYELEQRLFRHRLHRPWLVVFFEFLFTAYLQLTASSKRRRRRKPTKRSATRRRARRRY